MLGEMVRGPFTVADQRGRRALSVLSKIRCPLLQGQSNATHFGLPGDPTSTAPLRGNRSGISSPSSTTMTIRQRKNGNHCHHEILLTLATFAPGTAASYRFRSYQLTDGNSVLPVGG